MIGEKCEDCGDDVLITRTFNSKKLCLDCYEKQNNCHCSDSQHIAKTTVPYDGNQCTSSQCNKGIRYCIKCGRSIPFESIICPYCLYKFETY